jgi:hypothetical protein
MTGFQTADGRAGKDHLPVFRDDRLPLQRIVGTGQLETVKALILPMPPQIPCEAEDTRLRESRCVFQHVSLTHNLICRPGRCASAPLLRRAIVQ